MSRSRFLLPLVFLVPPQTPDPTEVRVYYDDLKVPHIYSGTDAAVFYGLGYQQMRDFPVETLSNLWSTSGRMAEVAGIRHLDLDADIRHLDIGIKALEFQNDLKAVELAGTPAERRDMLLLLNAYVAGVNAGRQWWIDNRGAREQLVGARTYFPCELELLPTGAAMNIEPAPFFLNDTHPHRPSQPNLPAGDKDVAWTPTAALDRLLEEDITVDHVLRFGILLQIQRLPGSFFVEPANILESPTETSGSATESPGIGSEGWMVKSGSSISTYSCIHVPLIRYGLRLYAVQMEGETYRASGIAMPGCPAVLVGFNEHLSWWVTNDSIFPFDRPTRQLSPRIRGYIGEATPVLRSKWTAPIISITRGASTPGFEIAASVACQQSGRICQNDEVVAIEQETMDLSYWNFGRGLVAMSEDDNLSPITREWVGKYRLGGIPRFPVARITRDLGTIGVVDVGDTITFEQSQHVLHTRSLWEFLFRLGRAPDIDGTSGNSLRRLIETENMILAQGSLNFCAADDQGAFLYWLAALVPKQGADLIDPATVGTVPRPWLDPDSPNDQAMNGTLRKRHWQGAHLLSEMPHLVDTDTDDKIWVQNNSSENYIDAEDHGRIDLSLFHDYITDAGNATGPDPADLGFGTNRQRDVEDLLINAMPIDQAENQDLALTKRDPWSRFYWPYFKAVANDAFDCQGTPTNVEVCNLVSFVELTKNEDESGGSGSEEFIAHATSRVIPYMMLLRSVYETQVLADYVVSRDDTDIDLIFAYDAYETAPSLNDVTTSSAYADTYAFISQALTTVAGYHANEGGAGGIYNHRLLMEDDLLLGRDNVNARMTGSEFFTESPWSVDDLYRDGNLRLGHCQMAVVTPHFVQRGTGRTNNQAWARAFYSSVWPSALDCADFMDLGPAERFGTHPYFDQTAAVIPMGGVTDSVYATAILGSSNGAYANGIMEIEDASPARLSFFLQFSAGGMVVLSVDVKSTGTVGYHRSIVGATELVADIRDYAGQAATDFFQSTDEYVNGDWTQLNIAETGAPRYTQRYEP